METMQWPKKGLEPGGETFRWAGRRGFTLVEIMASIGVVAVLAALCSVGFNKALFSARKVDSTAILRGYGTAFQNYMADNSEPPGPLYRSQAPYYTGNKGYLCAYLWTYFAEVAPEHKTVPTWLMAKHLKKWVDKQENLGNKAIYIVDGEVQTRDKEKIYPFGIRDDDVKVQPISWASVVSQVDLSTTRFMYEAFATKNFPERSPKRGEIQDYQGVLYMDGHIGIEAL